MAINKRTSTKKGTTYRVSLYDPLTQTTKWIGTFDDELGARQAELDAQKRMKSGLSPVGDENPKLAELTDKWLSYVRRASTKEDYKRGARFFLEFFGQRRIKTVRPEDFHRFAAFMTSQKKRNGHPYSPRVVHKTVTQLYQLINFAVELGYLDRSPAPKMKRLALPPVPPPRKIELSADQVRSLIDSAPEEWRCFFIVALATGTRRGELFNATYGAVRWEEQALEIRDERPDGTSGATKTAAAVRVVPLSPKVVEILRDRMVEMRATDSDLIFPNKDGGQMSYPNFYRRVWKPTALKAGMHDLHLHDLRKAFATHLAAGGHTPSYLEDVMGHKSFSTTMKYYTKSPNAEADKARKDVDDWLGQEASTQYGSKAA